VAEHVASGGGNAKVDHGVLQTALGMNEDAVRIAHRSGCAAFRARFGGDQL
jgi:hypothetical protein